MRDYFAKAAAYAQNVTVQENGVEKMAKAFIEPVSPVSPDYTERPTAMGLADDRRYLLIAERGAIDRGDTVEILCGDRVYELLRCEMIGGSHWEGIMRLKEG